MLRTSSMLLLDRLWLRNVLLSESESSEDSTDVSDEERSARDDARIREMLKEHVLMKKYRAKFAANPEDATDGLDESETWGDPCEDSESFSPISTKPGKSKKKGSAVNTVEAMNARRRKLWLHISKKEIGKVCRI
ncbi:hypothetical protein B566_EDAN016151 [Ephemera danica]|nr:hypothetical protein B566_EDAN016151 [Ephemera danica]